MNPDVKAKEYPNLPKLPDNLDQSLEKLQNNKKINNSFGTDVIASYLKLRNSEIKEFKQKEPGPDWDGVYAFKQK